VQVQKIEIAVIGAGAAGYFAAIAAASKGAKVHIFEKTTKTLTKVKVSGGGRCNVTHDCESPAQLVKYYPRGGRRLKKAFSAFGPKETRAWFESRGLALKTESDGRVFPKSDSSQSIIDCLESEANALGITLHKSMELLNVSSEQDSEVLLEFKNEKLYACQSLIIASGGSPQIRAYQFLKNLGLQLHDPIASLFTFNVPSSDLKELKGLSVNEGSVQVPGTKWRQEGPILITHWGFSAPAVIKLSAWHALEFFKRSYQFPILINWTNQKEDEIRENLVSLKSAGSKRRVATSAQFGIPGRLWQALMLKAEVPEDKVYADLANKELNRMVRFICTCPFEVNGKTTFKEEFVTAGGVDLQELDLTTFALKGYPNIFLAGEVLNIDGLTGGFNFQHAWTSGFLAGTASGERLL
jgi:predicted Rossmann fold flavoprotein